MHGRYMRAPAQEDDRPIRAQTVRRVIGTFRPYRRKVAWVGLAIVVTSGLGVVNPLLIKWIFDNGLFGNPPGLCAGVPCPLAPNGARWTDVSAVLVSVVATTRQ